jgi:hypothetical protein
MFTDGRDIGSRQLIWAKVPQYISYTKFHKDWLRPSKVDKDGECTYRHTYAR